MTKTNTEKRLMEEMNPNAVAVNDWQEMPVYKEGSKEYHSEWEKRNANEIKNSLFLDFGEQIRVIDETCVISAGYCKKYDAQGNRTDEDDTARPLIKFKWYDPLNAGHIYKLSVPPERLKMMYCQFAPCKAWDTVFPARSYTTANGLTVVTAVRGYDVKQLENLKSGRFAFRVWPQVETVKGKAQEKIDKYTPEPEEGQEIRTYFMHYLNGNAGQFELVELN